MIMCIFFGALFWIPFALYTAFKFMVCQRQHDINSDLDYWDCFYIIFSLIAWPLLLSGYILYRPAESIFSWMRNRADIEGGVTRSGGDL